MIASAGHGVQLPWQSTSDQSWKDHTLSFRDAISTCLHNLLPIVLLPVYIRRLPIKRLRAAEEGYREFGAYMRDILSIEMNLAGHEERHTLLSNLVKNRQVEGYNGEKIFTDDEIIGNTFIFLVAGHESTYLPLWQ